MGGLGQAFSRANSGFGFFHGIRVLTVIRVSQVKSQLVENGLPPAHRPVFKTQGGLTMLMNDLDQS